MSTKATDLIRAAPKFLGVPYSDLDCQAFVEAALRKIGIDENLAGSNAWYRHMTWVGTPEECKASFGRIPPGAFLFILERDGKEPEKYKSDGIGNASHIGIYTARGKGAIHSSSSRGMVCESAFEGKAISGGWNRVGLWDRFTYGATIDAILSGDPSQNNKDIEVVLHMTQAIVKTENGNGVNFRSKKSTDGGFLARIPEGSVLTVEESDGTWSSVIWNGKTGYVMSRFIEALQPDTDGITLKLDRTAAEALYDALGNALSGGGVG